LQRTLGGAIGASTRPSGDKGSVLWQEPSGSCESARACQGSSRVGCCDEDDKGRKERKTVRFGRGGIANGPSRATNLRAGRSARSSSGLTARLCSWSSATIKVAPTRSRPARGLTCLSCTTSPRRPDHRTAAQKRALVRSVACSGVDRRAGDIGLRCPPWYPGSHCTLTFGLVRST
jgi:hypothetical protein